MKNVRNVVNVCGNYASPMGTKYTLNVIKQLRDKTYLTSTKIVQFSRPSTPLIHLRPKFFYSRDLGRPISNESPSPPQVLTNQLKKKT